MLDASTAETRPRLQPLGERLADYMVGKTSQDLDVMIRALATSARDDFWVFRQFVHPDLIPSWWQKDACHHLQRFYNDWKRGLRPKLVLTAPPQHGKSYMMQDFAAWIAGKHPRIREIFASYSNELGTTANLHMQRLMLSDLYKMVFPNVGIAESGDRDPERLRRNTGIIEFRGGKGSFRNTTVDGQVTGFGLDLGIVDDPIKGRAEAQSAVTRNTAWNWLTNDFFTRFSDFAGFVMIQTRWHVDDPTGRWLLKFPKTKILVYRALAEKDDWSVRVGYRGEGEALFPQHKSLEFLMERKELLSTPHFESLYQQNPYEVGGGMFPIEKITTVPIWDRTGVKRSVRYWDKAGTEGGSGAFTAGVLMHAMENGTFVVEHVARGHWGALQREQEMLTWARLDRDRLMGTPYEVIVEQEPGSGGKESAENTIRNMSGFRVYADRVTGKGGKEIRAEPFAAQVQGGNVKLVAGPWQGQFLEELESFPVGKYKDQVDAASGAFMRLVSGPRYNLNALAS